LSPILKLDHDDPEKELAFELDYQLSLTTRQRFQMMIERGFVKPVEIIKRRCE